MTPRAAQGFTTARAQRWVMGAAFVTALIYAFRRLIEGVNQPTQARGSTAGRLAGQGSPPPTLAHWAYSYGIAFLVLAGVATGAPELAAGLSMLIVLANALANGKAITTDIQGLQSSSTPKASPLASSTAASGLGTSFSVPGFSNLTPTPPSAGAGSSTSNLIGSNTFGSIL